MIDLVIPKSSYSKSEECERLTVDIKITRGNLDEGGSLTHRPACRRSLELRHINTCSIGGGVSNISKPDIGCTDYSSAA